MAFKAPRHEVETTYADLAEGESIIDKAGNEWLALGVAHTVTEAEFWLADPKTKVRAHRLAKPLDAAVTVLRRPSRAEEIEQREAEVDAAEAVTRPLASGSSFGGGDRGLYPTEAESVAAVEEVLGGEVLAEETADHERAREVADAGEGPMSLPPFAEFTDAEMRSHLFLVHGTYAHDIKARKALVKAHDDLHADPRHTPTPHDHNAKEFPA